MRIFWFHSVGATIAATQPEQRLPNHRVVDIGTIGHGQQRMGSGAEHQQTIAGSTEERHDRD